MPNGTSVLGVGPKRQGGRHGASACPPSPRSPDQPPLGGATDEYRCGRNTCGRADRPGRGLRARAARPRVRGGPHGAQRSRRPAAGSDRPLPRHERCHRGARARAPGESRGLDPRWRTQRRGPRRHRRRADDRPIGDEADRGRPCRCDRRRRRRRHLGRAERGSRSAWPRGHRRSGLGDGHRRVHPRRRTRLADGQVRAGLGQPARRRAGHRRRRRPPRRRRIAPRPVLGTSRRGRQLRRRDDFHLPAARGGDDRRRPDRPPDRRRSPTCSASTGTPSQTPRTT